MNAEESMARLHVWIEGIVQGVFFRGGTQKMAREAGLVGWVRNLNDGRVEAVFQGERAACEKALLFVNSGPPGARVNRVEAVWEQDEEPHTGFKIRFS